MISSIKLNYAQSGNNLGKFSLIFLLSLQASNFALAKTQVSESGRSHLQIAQNEPAKPVTLPGPAGAAKQPNGQQFIKDEINLDKSWAKDKKKEDSIGKLISALDQKAHEKKRVKAKNLEKTPRASASSERLKVKKNIGAKTPQAQPVEDNDTLFDDFFSGN